MGGRSKAVRQALNGKPLEAPMAYPCHKGHDHAWPVSGPITKEDVGPCQVMCQFCALDPINPTYHEAKWGWQLRRHVYQVHKNTHPGLIVPEEWSGKKETSKGKTGPRKDETQTGKKKPAKTPVVYNILNDTTCNAVLPEAAGTGIMDNTAAESLQIQPAGLVEIDWDAFLDSAAFEQPYYAAPVCEYDLNNDSGSGSEFCLW